MDSMSELRARAKQLGLSTPLGTKKVELSQKIKEAEEAQFAPRITIAERSNPELEPVKVMNDVVAGNETDSQRRAQIEREIRSRLEREDIEKALRKEAAIAERKKAQMDKYVLKYDLSDMKEQCEKLANASGCRFVIDTKPDGSLEGTYHIYGTGKVASGNLAQPLEIIKRDVRFFCAARIDSDTPRRDDMVRSQFTGQPIAATVQFGNQPITNSGDIAVVDLGIPQ